jgi:hypothetical protein
LQPPTGTWGILVPIPSWNWRIIQHRNADVRDAIWLPIERVRNPAAHGSASHVSRHRWGREAPLSRGEPIEHLSPQRIALGLTRMIEVVSLVTRHAELAPSRSAKPDWLAP